MDRKTWSSLTTVLLILVVLIGYFNIPPAGPWIRSIFFNTRALLVNASRSPAQAPVGNPGTAAGCLANMRQIEAAKVKIRQERGAGAVTWDDINRAAGRPVGAIWRCPGGGIYILGTLEVTVRCSLGRDHRL